MRTSRLRMLQWSAAAFFAGTCFQLGGCGVGGALSWLTNLNPCGTILDCDPRLYRFQTSGYEGPGADPDVDPACTYPPFCGDEDPFVPNIFGGGG